MLINDFAFVHARVSVSALNKEKKTKSSWIQFPSNIFFAFSAAIYYKSGSHCVWAYLETTQKTHCDKELVFNYFCRLRCVAFAALSLSLSPPADLSLSRFSILSIGLSFMRSMRLSQFTHF